MLFDHLDCFSHFGCMWVDHIVAGFQAFGLTDYQTFMAMCIGWNLYVKIVPYEPMAQDYLLQSSWPIEFANLLL